MAQVGGIRIPFVVDMSDIPRSVREVDKELKRLRKKVGDIDLYLDGKHIDQLNRQSLIPAIQNFEKIERKANAASAALSQIGRAMGVLRRGQTISDGFVSSLSKLPQVGKKTVAQIRVYSKLNTELQKVRKRADEASDRMKGFDTTIRKLEQREGIVLPLSKDKAKAKGKDAKLVTGDKAIRQMMAVGISPEAYAALEKYETKYKAIVRTQEKGGKVHRTRLNALNIARNQAIKLLKKEQQLESEKVTKARIKEKEKLERQVARAREKALKLLEKDHITTNKELGSLQQRAELIAKPVKYKGKELQYFKEQEKIYSKLMVKYRLRTITDRERIKLQQVMINLSKKEGWIEESSWQVRLRLLDKLNKEIREKQLQEKLGIAQKNKERALQRLLNHEQRKGLELEKKKRSLRERFPGGGLFSASRVTWFIQLRAFWEVYRVVGKIMSDLVELDEAVARSMRTMSSDTENYGEVADRVHSTILRTARDTGATYRDVGEALYQLSSAGLSAEESLAAVNSVMRLTRTTEAEVTDATKVIAGVFNNFKESLASVSTDTARFNLISSTLSYVWERNQVDMNEMVQALNQAAQVSRLAGVDFTELAVIIGNLGTMMIRSGRAGRSIRTAIIQMVAKGQQLAEVFGFTFDPSAPLSFMKTMDLMAEQWKDMAKSALVAHKVTQIFGRRGAPAILALLKNWEKVREEIEGVSDPLEMLTNQHEKLLRLQARYRQVTETVWKEFMVLVAETFDVVKWFGNQMHDVLLSARYRRSVKELSMDFGELAVKYQDAGELTDRLAKAQAELRIAQQKLNDEVNDGIGVFRSYARIGAAALKWASRGKIKEDVSIFAGTDPIAVIENYTELIEKYKKLEVLNRQSAIITRRRKEREAELATDIHTRTEAELALVRTLRLHRAERGELILTQKELHEDLETEISSLKVLEDRWVQVYRKHGENAELLDGLTKDIEKQSDAVKKLSKALQKMHDENIKKVDEVLKREKALTAYRRKQYSEYSKIVEQRTGLNEDESIRQQQIRVNELTKEREDHIDAMIRESRHLLDLEKYKDEYGRIRPEFKEEYKKTEERLVKENRLREETNEKLKDAQSLLKELYRVRDEGLRAGGRRPENVVSLEQLGIIQRPEDLAKLHAKRAEQREDEKEHFELRIEYRDRFLNALQIREGKEREIEKARLDSQLELQDAELAGLKTRRTEVRKEIAATLKARKAAELKPEEYKREQERLLTLQQEEKVVGRQIDNLIKRREYLQKTRDDVARQELVTYDELILNAKKMSVRHKEELAQLDLRQKYVEESAVTAGYTTRESLRGLDRQIEKMRLESAHRKERLSNLRKQKELMEALARTGEFPEGMLSQYRSVTDEIKSLEIAARAAGIELGHLTSRRPGTEFLADLAYLDRLKEQRDKEQQHELRMFDIRTAYKEKYQTFFSLWTSKEELQEKERLKDQRIRLGIEIRNMKERRDKVSQEMAHLQTMLGVTTDPQLRSQYKQRMEQLSAEYGDLGFGITEREEQAKALQKTKTEMVNQNIRNLKAEGQAVDAAKLTWAYYGDTIQSYTGQMATAWRDMFAEMGKTNKDAWDIYKGIAIAQAIVDTIKTAQAGAAALAGIPFIGPALATAWVATSIAQGMFRVRQIETTRPQGYAQGGVTYGELKMLDKRRARSSSFATGGVTSGPTLAAVGDNKSGREIILPEEHIHDDYVGPAYRRDRGGEPLNIINLVTDKSIAAAMMRQPGKNVIINAIGEDLQRKKSTYKQVRGMRR